MVTTAAWNPLWAIALPLQNVMKMKEIVINMKIVKQDWYVANNLIIAEKSGDLTNSMIVAWNPLRLIALQRLHVMKTKGIVIRMKIV